MAQILLIPQAKQAEVARIVRATLEGQGVRLDEQTHSHIVFHGLREAGGFRRGGYVGMYQAVGEKSVEVVVQAWAVAPRRAFWGTVGSLLALILVMFVASLASSVWFLGAIAMWLLFGAAALVYYLTFRGTLAVEDALRIRLKSALAGAGLAVQGEEEQLEQRVRLRLEGELKEREMGAKAPPPPRIGRRRGAPPAADEPGGKRKLFGRKDKNAPGEE